MVVNYGTQFITKMTIGIVLTGKGEQTMADIDNVVKGLGIAALHLNNLAQKCAIYSALYADSDFCLEAIESLKEQEAVEPYIAGSGESFETAETWWYECGNCNKPIDPNDKFCRHCGKPVKWE